MEILIWLTYLTKYVMAMILRVQAMHLKISFNLQIQIVLWILN